MKKSSLILGLTAASALVLAQAAYAAAISDSSGGGGVGAAADPVSINVGFSEEIDNTLTHTTDQVHSGDRGIQPGVIFTVDKGIHNIATSKPPWNDFHIQLQVLRDGVWVNSDDSDGVSFGDIEPFGFPPPVPPPVCPDPVTLGCTFLADAHVDINGVDQGPPAGVGFPFKWSVGRDTTNDTLDYFFDGFVVNPEDTLSLHFDMSDNGDNVWRLVETASAVPEIDAKSGGAAIALLLGVLALAGERCRKWRDAV